MPDGRASSLSNGLHRGRRHRGQYHVMAFRCRRPGSAKFRVCMVCALTTYGAEKNRGAGFAAKDVNRSISLADINEPSRLDLKSREACAVRSQR